MSDNQDALRLADDLIHAFSGQGLCAYAAAELRRLHSLNAELMEALRQIEPILARMYGAQAADLPPMQIVRAALAKAGESE